MGLGVPDGGVDNGAAPNLKHHPQWGSGSGGGSRWNPSPRHSRHLRLQPILLDTRRGCHGAVRRPWFEPHPLLPLTAATLTHWRRRRSQ